MTSPVRMTLPVIPHLPNLVAVGLPPDASHAKPTEVVISAERARVLEHLPEGEPVWVIDQLSERVLCVIRGTAGLLAATDPGWTRHLASAWDAATDAGDSQ